MQSHEQGTALFDATMNLQRTEISHRAAGPRAGAISFYNSPRYRRHLLAGAAPVAETRSLLSPSIAEQRKPMSQTTAPTLHSSQNRSPHPCPTLRPVAWL